MDKIRFTSIDSYINKFPNKIEDSIFDLEQLALNFNIDNFFSNLEYSQKVGKGGIETLINRPPVGPIPSNFMCTFCQQYGPNFHLITCPNPSKRSLVLTYEGFKNIIKNLDYDGPFKEDVLLYRSGKKLEILNKYFEPFITKTIKEGRTHISIPDDAFSTIVYDDVVKIKGKDPQAPKTLTVRFSNIVSLYYKLEGKTTNIRIYKDGTIDIKNLPQTETDKQQMIESLLQKINETGSLNKTAWKKLLTTNKIGIVENYTVIPQFSYIYLFHAQYYMFGEEKRKEQEINFELLENILETKESNRFISVIDGNNYLNIDNYEIEIKSKAAIGKKIIAESMENKTYILSVFDLNISLFITKYGVFQYTISSNNLTLTGASQILTDITNYFISLFKIENIAEKTFITQEALIYSMKETQDTTVTGLVPPKSQSQRSGTEICRKTQAGVEMQPKPYSWTGKCANDEYAVAIGIDSKYRGGDVRELYNGVEQQLFYPCCEKMTARTRQNYIERLKKGFTLEEQELYGIFPNRDYLSGILIPDSTKKGAIADVLLPSETEYTKVEVLEIPKKIKPDALYKVKRLSDSKIFSVPRLSFKRDSRYFRGLNTLNKDELIQILLCTNTLTQGKKLDLKTIKNLNLDTIKWEYINFSAFIDNFTSNVYKLTRVPYNTTQVYLYYKNKKEQYYINSVSNLKLDSSVSFIDGTIIAGYLNENDSIFYPLYIINAPTLIESTNLIEANLIGDKDTVILPEYFDNIIEAANYLIKNESDSRLLFIPSNLQNSNYYFDENIVSPVITVQIIERLFGKYIFGYDNVPFNDQEYQLVIPSNIAEFEYIKITGKYNQITKKLDSLKPLQFVEKTERKDISFEKALLNFNEIFNGIDYNFFTLYDGEYILINDKKYKISDTTSLLIEV